jgi:hypothetical protein
LRGVAVFKGKGASDMAEMKNPAITASVNHSKSLFGIKK